MKKMHEVINENMAVFCDTASELSFLSEVAIRNGVSTDFIDAIKAQFMVAGNYTLCYVPSKGVVGNCNDLVGQGYKVISFERIDFTDCDLYETKTVDSATQPKPIKTKEKEIDWEQRRWEGAIQVLAATANNVIVSGDRDKERVEQAIKMVDELIKQMKQQ